MTTNAVFQKELKRSKRSVIIVAELLKRRGYRVEIHPDLGVPDECDIYIWVRGRKKHIEVKHSRTLDFTGVSDINYKDVIIDRAHRIDWRLEHNINDLHAYYLCNWNLTKAIVLTPRSRKYWFKMATPIKRDNEIASLYYIPRDKIRKVVNLR